MGVSWFKAAGSQRLRGLGGEKHRVVGSSDFNEGFAVDGRRRLRGNTCTQIDR